MLPKDYVRLKLTGERATDVADASGTLLFDVAGRRWSAAMCEALELDPAWLPPALECAEASGRTPEGVVVAAGGGDQAAGALGVGIDGPGPASVVLGTSGVVFTGLEDYAADPEARVTSSATPSRAPGTPWGSSSPRPGRCSGCATSRRPARTSARSSRRPRPGTRARAA
jgi:sugar (pentulose or hexulose) kinase